MSTRKVKAITEQLCGIEVSAMQVSRAAAKLDAILQAWRERPLGEMSYLYVDARYEKVRDAGQVRDAAVLIAIGITPAGERQVLGVSVSLNEHETHSLHDTSRWKSFLRSLKDHGMEGVKLVISDDHTGLGAAVTKNVPVYYYEQVFYTLKTLPDVPKLPGPKFVFVHIPVPHRPHIFKPDGSLTSDTSIYPPESDIFKSGFIDQLNFINPRMLDIIDALLSNSDNPPVIILQSDHGPIYNEDHGYKPQEEVFFPILNAIYIPGISAESIPEDFSPVNTFRLVFNHIFNQNLPLLENYHHAVPSSFDFQNLQSVDQNFFDCAIK